MSSDITFTAVRELLDAQWSGAPLAWPNEPAEFDSGMPWIYMDMSGNDMSALELGGASAAYAEAGTIWAHIHCPVGTGTLEIRAIAKQLSNLFRAATVPGITFGRQGLGAGEPGDDDGLYWRQTFTVSYTYQDVLT